MTTKNSVSAKAALNFPELLARVENDRELLAELFSIFKADFPHSLQRLRGAVSKRDSALAASVSHTLKGTLSNLAANSAATAAASLEKLARSGELAALPSAFAEFEKLAAALLSEIEALTATEVHS